MSTVMYNIGGTGRHWREELAGLFIFLKCWMYGSV